MRVFDGVVEVAVHGGASAAVEAAVPVAGFDVVARVPTVGA
ncbi:MAG: hypothetical protein V9G10_06510 [Candidatus Nanopelagicales bacterium]